MFERDHIMRQINLLAQAISRARSLRSESREAEAMKELDRALEALSGNLEPERPSPDDIFRLCIGPDGNLMPFAADVALILTLKGDSFLESGRLDQARDCYSDALRIYEANLRKPGAGIPWDIRERIDGLKERLQDAGEDEP